MATNNTLLLFSRLYQLAPFKFSEFLNQLLEEADLRTGVLFSQQTVGSKSVPDGIIAQESFKVIIETKRHDKFSVDQLTAHLDSFGQEQRQILLALSPQMIGEALRIQVESEIIRKGVTNVRLVCTTFQLIINAFRDTLNEYDFELHDIINDYEGYCATSNLLDNTDSLLRVVPCGWTLDLNVKYKLYFAPADRGFTKHSYLGLYKEMRVQWIGEICNIVTADLADGETLNILNQLKGVSGQQAQTIIGCITETKLITNWSIHTGHTFFCVDEFYETNFMKQSKYGLQGTRLFNLKTLIGSVPFSTEDIAEQLKGKPWPIRN